jgi:antibiotic biosynthesis monooxygenase (ABM) superfamily enzyme
MPSYYYGFRYFGGRTATTGKANPKNKRRNTWGVAVAFKSLDELNAWLLREDRNRPIANGGGIRERVKNRQKLRDLHAGMTWLEFCEFINGLHWRVDVENVGSVKLGTLFG